MGKESKNEAKKKRREIIKSQRKKDKKEAKSSNSVEIDKIKLLNIIDNNDELNNADSSEKSILSFTPSQTETSADNASINSLGQENDNNSKSSSGSWVSTTSTDNISIISIKQADDINSQSTKSWVELEDSDNEIEINKTENFKETVRKVQKEIKL